MSPEQSQNIFEDFCQADSSIHAKYGGTGLGLSISQKLALQMNGSVQLTSTEVGIGSIFRVELPFQRSIKFSIDKSNLPDDQVSIDCQRGGTQEDTKRSNSPGSLHGKRILLAEDGKDNQKLIAMFIRKAGGTIDIADDGKSALDFFERNESGEHAYDLILTDIDMPEMNGYELAKTLRSRGNSIPIIATTAYALADDKQKCLDAGCDAYISKPIDRSELVAAVSSWVTRRLKDRQSDS
jgi:CheY-like chemotaxis protein